MPVQRGEQSRSSLDDVDTHDIETRDATFDAGNALDPVARRAKMVGECLARSRVSELHADQVVAKHHYLHLIG